MCTVAPACCQLQLAQKVPTPTGYKVQLLILGKHGWCISSKRTEALQLHQVFTPCQVGKQMICQVESTAVSSFSTGFVQRDFADFALVPS